MIDPELVRRKLCLILSDLKALDPLVDLPLGEYVASELHKLASERLLERIAGRMIDVNFHVVTESGSPPPKDYYDSFLEMGRLGVLPDAFSRSIASAAGLRNRLVHEYDALDPVRVHGALATASREVPEYVRQVEAYLSRLLADDE